MTPTRRERRFYSKAREASLQSDHRTNIGAVIVIGNYVVAKGCNREKSHPRQHWYDRKTNYHSCRAKLHAEINALISSGRTDLTGAEIYVYRETTKGQVANCKPCSSCTQALKDAGVKHVYYTNREGFAYEQF